MTGVARDMATPTRIPNIGTGTFRVADGSERAAAIHAVNRLPVAWCPR